MRPSAWLENVSPHIRESKTVLDSDPRQSWILDSEPCILDSLSMELRSRSRIVGEISWAGFRIPKPGIPDSNKQNFVTFRFSQATFSGFRNPYSLTWGEMWLQDLPDRIKIKSMFCFCFSDDRLKRFRARKQRRIRVENQVCTDKFWVVIYMYVFKMHTEVMDHLSLIGHVTDASPSLGAHTTA